ncbi:MAG: hypothetical protein GY711_00530 [bacterium]|nr:hypothetical protein [bacterium]
MVETNEAPEQVRLSTVDRVFAEVHEEGIRYCHWKSNHHLHFALAATEDLDLLIEKARFSEFVQILLANGFKPAETLTSRQQPGVYHFLGNDADAGRVINVHAYTRILTGDHLLKSSTWPLERLLLESTREHLGIRVPSASAELIVYAFRAMVKQTTVMDHYFLWRSKGGSEEELQWLLSAGDMERSRSLLARYFPEIEYADFERALALCSETGTGAFLSRLRLGFRFRRALSKYQRYGSLRRTSLTFLATLKMGWNKIVRRQKPMMLQDGGVVIAFVGPQATGKSTLVKHLRAWLGRELAVMTIHAGKPPATWVTFVPSKLIPILRMIHPDKSTGNVERAIEGGEVKSPPLLFLVRKVMLAWDRRSLLRDVYRQSRNGRIVLSDRYPSELPGAIDGRSFGDEQIEGEKSGFKRWLMAKERSLYAEIPPPDLVFQLSAPVDLAVKRNEERNKEGDQTEEYVRFRHSSQALPVFTRCPVECVATDRGLTETQDEVRRLVWKHV